MVTADVIQTRKDSTVTNSQTFSDIYQSVAKQAGSANMAEPPTAILTFKIINNHRSVQGQGAILCETC